MGRLKSLAMEVALAMGNEDLEITKEVCNTAEEVAKLLASCNIAVDSDTPSKTWIRAVNRLCKTEEEQPELYDVFLAVLEQREKEGRNSVSLVESKEGL